MITKTVRFFFESSSFFNKISSHCYKCLPEKYNISLLVSSFILDFDLGNLVGTLNNYEQSEIFEPISSSSYVYLPKPFNLIVKQYQVLKKIITLKHNLIFTY